MNNELISTMTERIVRDFHPVQIILFGSRARGDAQPQSDVDLLVVFSELADKRKTAVDIRRALADLPMAKDILVTTPEELARQRDQVGTILRAAQREGEILYERNLQKQEPTTRKNPIAQRLIAAMEKLPHLTHEDVEALRQSIEEGKIPIKFDSPFESDERQRQ